MTGISKHLSLWTAALALTVGGVIAAPAAGAASDDDCVVRVSDNRLWCGNNSPVITRKGACHEAPVTGQLLANYSWFDCWTSGELHGGGNTIWYHTAADWAHPNYDEWGYVPADWVGTTGSFEADPTAHGLRRC
ncbi:hypothetical protein QFZ75_004817 [Streptomyces sp. V3I8]|uniref:hypothetical protein n=1 Tax=Streptomyces sp. V3I8 TaxID=3042279 RepID=UPI00277D9562|nr:hypothetical protein [Streptomyces sp. V3I8]MDQ1038401.1 hypothetical protein [Streptomyces sp. V3I8]